MAEEKNIGLKDWVASYPFRGYPFDVSEDGKRFMLTVYMKKGSSINDFEAFSRKIGLLKVHGIGLTEYRPANQINARAGNIFQVWPKENQGSIELVVYGSAEDISSFIDHAEEGQLISQPELVLGSVAYHFLRGKALWEKKRIDEAEAEYKKSLEISTQTQVNEKFKVHLENMVADTHFNLGLVFKSRAESQKAKEEFEIYLQHDTSSEWAEKARDYIRNLS